MTFNQNWEKTDKQHQLPAGVIEEIVKLAYPDKKLLSHEAISGGRSNLNIKINVEGDEQPLIVRIYLCDKDASYREKRLGTLLKQTVPIPLTYHIGDYEDYRFAITEFIPGITLHNFLLSAVPHDVGPIMYETGALLAKLTEYVFPKAGFFDKDLNVIESASQDSYLTFDQGCLQNKVVLTQLSSDTISKIHFYLKEYAHLFPGKNEKHLVHADFDPTNILVDKVDGAWKVMGVLDWEFSHSGSVLYDIATMLRYAHQMPEESFLQGLKSGGIHLPDHWRITVHMLNLCSLLDCLTRADPKNRPNQCAGICSLISFCLRQLEAIRGIRHE